MIYVTSDLHGCSLKDFAVLLEGVKFSYNDTLYVLGDVIDRGVHGIDLLRFMMMHSNIELILGNHESMMLGADFALEELTDESIGKIDDRSLACLADWIANGGEPTIAAAKAIKNRDPELLADIIDYVRSAPLYETVSTDAGDFLLVHAGLDNFSPERKLSSYTEEELLWARPTFDDKYFDDVITVFGHTPTGLFGSEYRGKILKTDTWIDIDTGHPPALLCLDNMKEFYL